MHKGIFGIDECADAIAKHSASHDFGHDVHFQPPAPDGNAYTHPYWLAAKDTNKEHDGRRGASTSRLRALSDVNAKPHMPLEKVVFYVSVPTGRYMLPS
jgi:hypothetical protein